ncbi:hypothetical protein [Mycobacterium sp. RTGN4]|uniref:hypothetical protein n=1 Tax=Mycobacterium sp. RTGN4 TaxID=3016523 RepID=UPI0029C6655F|nr:hypothetical protein [Mycobacterium sp. RTGN4]
MLQVTQADRTYTYSLGEGVRHVHMLLGTPLSSTRPEDRGGLLLSRILGRDDTIVDPAASTRIIEDIARLAGDPSAG